jgi:hypothetical protein
MKTKCFFSLFIVLTLSHYAQLKFTPAGNFGVGTTNPLYTFHMSGNYALFSSASGAPNASAALIRAHNGVSSPTTPDYTFLGNDQVGMFHPGTDVLGFSTSGAERLRISNSETWIRTNAYFSSQSLPPSCAYIRQAVSFSGPSTPDYTWVGNDQAGLYHLAQDIFGVSVAGAKVMEFYAPWQSDQVDVFGNFRVYGNISYSSDQRFKSNIITLKEASKKLLKLRGVSYEFKTEEFKKFGLPSGPQIGFIAQELKEILPELVKEDGEGYLAINYQAIIPILVEGFKEHQVEIEQLNSKVALLESQTTQKNGSQTPTGSGNELGTLNEGPILYQNTPNPFNVETVIKYFVPRVDGQPEIVVFDVNGLQKKTFTITRAGYGSVVIPASELSKGLYFYTLRTKERVVDAKTMIVTE